MWRGGTIARSSPWLGIRRVQILLVEVVSQPLRPSVNLVQAFKTHRKMSALKID
jgi:hypothetical protein